MPDVFTWPMDATAHSAAVSVLRDEIVKVHQASGDLPISTIFLVLPVRSAQIPDAVNRGSFQVRGDRFQNVADDELWMQFDDPTMGSFFATVPATLAGSVNVIGGGNEIRITFDQPIALEIPQLAALGVGRSSFQKLIRIALTADRSISFLQDNADPNKETNIDVRLRSGMFVSYESLAAPHATSVSGLVTLSSSCGGGGDPNDPNWSVIRRINDGICFVHYGDIVMGGSQAYDVIFGPTTQDQCNAYQNTHCPDGFC